MTTVSQSRRLSPPVRLQQRRLLSPSGPKPPPPPRRRVALAARPARAPSPRRAHAHNPAAARNAPSCALRPPAAAAHLVGAPGRGRTGARPEAAGPPPAAGHAHLALPTLATPHSGLAWVPALPPRSCGRGGWQGQHGGGGGRRGWEGVTAGSERRARYWDSCVAAARGLPEAAPREQRRGAGQARPREPGEKGENSPPPTEVPGGWGRGAVGNQGLERSTGSWSIEEDTLRLSPALGLKTGNSANCTWKCEASGTARTSETRCLGPCIHSLHTNLLSYCQTKDAELEGAGGIKGLLSSFWDARVSSSVTSTEGSL